MIGGGGMPAEGDRTTRVRAGCWERPAGPAAAAGRAGAAGAASGALVVAALKAASAA